MIDPEKIVAALNKTGFPLENFVSRSFAQKSWAILSNRYYVDDVDGKARELDLIAYKVVSVDGIELVMGALISCKKDEENLWAFLTRDKPSKDPNNDWNPINHWTNYEPLRTYLNSDSWKAAYFSKSGKNVRKIFSAERDVFARQQVSKSKLSPQNDKAMFDAASGLMKAMVHEMNILPRKPKHRRVYVFVPVIVAETSFVDVAYKEEVESVLEVSIISQLTNYIVGRSNVSAIVHFVTRDHLARFIQVFDDALIETETYLPKLIEDSFAAIASNKEVRNYFLDVMKHDLGWSVRWRAKKLELTGDVSISGLEFLDKQLVIEIDCLYGELDKLKSDERLNLDIKNWLKKKARYTGKYTIDCSIPF